MKMIRFGQPAFQIGARPSFGAGISLAAEVRAIVLTSPNGTVFRTAEGRVLVRGTRTVTQEQSSG